MCLDKYDIDRVFVGCESLTKERLCIQVCDTAKLSLCVLCVYHRCPACTAIVCTVCKAIATSISPHHPHPTHRYHKHIDIEIEIEIVYINSHKSTHTGQKH